MIVPTLFRTKFKIRVLYKSGTRVLGHSFFRREW